MPTTADLRSSRDAAGPRRSPRLRSGSRWRGLQWPILGLVALATAALGHAGYAWQLKGAGSAQYSFFDYLYFSLRLFAVEMDVVQPPLNPALNVARFLAPAVAGYAVLQAIGQLFAEELQSLRLRFLRGHVIVAGLGHRGLVLTRGFLEEGRSVVVIDQDAENDLIVQCRDLGAKVLIGDAAQEWLLRSAGVLRATHLFALCGDDGTNAEVAVTAASLMRDRGGEPLTCVVHVFDAQLCALLRERELDRVASGGMRLEFFNVYDFGARVLLDEYPVVPPEPDSRADQPPAPGEMLIVGAGRLAEGLVTHAARQWRARPHPSDARLRVTLVDRHASAAVADWLLRYPALSRSCELAAVDGDVHAAALRQLEIPVGADASGPGPARFFVCLDDDSRNLSTALALADRVRDHDATIVVRMDHDGGLATLVGAGDPGLGSFARLRAFGLLDRTCHPSQVLRGTHEILARAIHGEYLRQQRAAGVSPADNPSMVPWDALPAHLKESNRQQADDIGAKLRAVRCSAAPLLDWDEPLFEFKPDEIDRLARAEHERWAASLRKSGWRQGPTKDSRARTHPCLVDFDDLSPDDQNKDRNAVREIPAMLAGLGFRVHRLRERSA